jgi:hypothetical protein
MKVGHAQRDITPEPGVTLSGFVSRGNKPSSGIDDPILVHALSVEDHGEVVLILVYDLLAMGEEITAEISSAVQKLSDGAGLQVKLALCCTHTHSAPAAIKLIGCGIPDLKYWELLVKASSEAAREALANLRPALLRYLAVTIPNVSHNRRSLLEDGRVVMGRNPATPVIKVGPTWDRLLLVRFEDESGKGIAGIANWSAHPAVVCTQNISADYPGELRRRLSLAFDVPFIYLQGACGNINLPFRRMVREEMLENVDSLMNALSIVAWPPARRADASSLLSRSVRLAYAPIPRSEELEQFRNGMQTIARAGSGPPSIMSILANILNVEPGEQPDPAMARFIAAALSQWSQELLEKYDDVPTGADLAIKVWRLEPLAFCFIAAEVFVETAIQLQETFHDRMITVVGYASPLVGYLPTDDALLEGGYEVEYAYRFYGHPAPFAKGSEPAVVEALRRALASDIGGRGAQR